MVEENKIAKAKELAEELEDLNQCRNLLKGSDIHLNIVTGKIDEKNKVITHCFPDMLIPEIGQILENRIIEVWVKLQKLVSPVQSE